MRDDAVRRALRYKKWEKDQQSADKKAGDESAKDDAETEKPTEENTKNGDTNNDDKDQDDEQRWLSLSDGDKRKEYKRARKVLDVIKVTGESN